MRSRIRVLLALAIGATALSATAQQAPWPTRPVRWVVPWAPGGAADVTARTVAQKLSERWGQPVTIDNKPGGNTVIAAQEVARAAPDGYTLFQPIAQTLTVNQFLYSKLPYDPVRDFTPITILAHVPLLLMGSERLQARTLPELIELAKKNPNTITIAGSSGNQLQLEQWMRDWDVKFRYVPYKSGVDIMKAVLSSETDLGVDAIPNNLPHVKSGKMKGLAITAPKRLASMPEVPTMDELKIKHTEPPIWHALVGPAGLPPAIQNKIAADVRAVLAMPDVSEKLLGLGLDPSGVSPQEFAARIRSEAAVAGPLVKELGLKVD